MIVLLIFVTTALVVIALIAVLNTITFPRLRNLTPRPPLHVMERGSTVESDQFSDTNLFISILIPARNEAAVIGDTVRSLLAQAYNDLEILVLDDQSDDGTAEVALAAANGDVRLRVLEGEALPAGWLGKNWACHQLARAAKGDVLVFADADVRWQPGAVQALLDEMVLTRADLLTVWSKQQTITWGERLVVPLMAFVIIGYLPVVLVHGTPWSAFAAANGQCLAFRRAAYEAVGGHAAVRLEIVEDIVLARRIKRRGLRLRVADGNGLIVCRMYRGWRSVRDGYAKNIIAGYGGRVSFLLVATLFHWLILLAPWLWLFTEYRVWALMLILLGLGIRALTAAATRQRVQDAVLLPVSALLMTIIAAQAVWWQWRGGPQWKGRTLAPRT